MSMEFKTYVPQVLSELDKRKARALEVAGGMIEGYAKQLCPVDTGNLRNSIAHEQEDADTEVIGSNVHYAPFVELGTCKMRAQPYLRPAFENHRGDIEKAVKQEMGW